MASLRLTFPEKDQPTVIALTGARLTIGRLPFNTIQIIDRTVSGFHAELIAENGHYRLHDRGSSNGTFVNGQKVGDYHLNEPCSITFGTVEAQFSPEALPAEEEVESFPTRSEVNAVRQENADLKSTIAALREEAEALRSVRPIEGGAAALAVSKEEFDKVVVERETLKEARLKQDEEIARLKADLSVLKRDRVNLQLAYDGVQRELNEQRAKAGGNEEIKLAPKDAAVALAAQAPKINEEIRIEVPVPAPKPAAEVPAPSVSAPPPEPAPAAAEVTPAPTTPTAPPSPMPPPAAPVSLPQAPSLPGAAPTPPSAAPRMPPAPRMPSKPFAPLPKAPAVAATGVVKPAAGGPPTPIKAPPGLGGGVRPLPAKPLSPIEGVKTQIAPAVPVPRLVPRPNPSAHDQPTVKIMPVPQPKVGPKGTQKLN